MTDSFSLRRVNLPPTQTSAHHRPNHPPAPTQGDARRPARGRRFAIRPGVEELESRLAPAITFGPEQIFTGFLNPAKPPVVADFNGDGKPDVAIPSSGDRTVQIVVNTTPAGSGAVSFSPFQALADPQPPVQVAAADFNGDGKPDLFVDPSSVGGAYVYVNTTPTGAGAVSFAAPQSFALLGTDSLAIADLNGDGKPDVIVTSSFFNEVLILMNTTPTGSTTVSFAAQQTFAVTGLNGQESLTTADLNGDGKPDLIFTNYANQSVSVLLNTTPTGSSTVSFGAQQTFAVGNNPKVLTVADLNGDGKPDLITTNPTDNTVSVLMNTTATGAASASFAAQQTFATGTNPLGLVAADFNGDGKPDLVIANASAASLTVLQNTTATGAASASFTAETLTLSTGHGFALAGDFNGDSRPDLLLTAGAVSVLVNTTVAGPTAYTQAVPVTQALAKAITLTGVAPNGDVLSFTVTTNPTHGTLSGFNSSTGQVTYTPTGTYLGADSFQFTVTDTVTNQTSAAAAVSVSVAAPVTPTPPVSFATRQTFNLGNTLSGVAVADLNGDGKPDLVVANPANNALTVALNTTTAGSNTLSFAAAQTFAAPNAGPAVLAADFNGDGKPDLVVGGLNGVDVLRNTTATGTTAASFAAAQTFLDGPTLLTGYIPDAITVADVNGDGKPDIVIVSASAGLLIVLLNTTPAGATNLSFAAAQSFNMGVGGTTIDVQAADLNGDGKPDIVVTNVGSSAAPNATVAVLLNTTATGSATAAFAAPVAYPVGPNPRQVAVADLNGDGKPDLIVTNNGGGFGTITSVLVNETSAGASVPFLATQQPYAVGLFGPTGVVTADFDGNGRPDFAVLLSTPLTMGGAVTTVSVLQNVTPAGATLTAFNAPQAFTVGNNNLYEAVGDFNGDGRPDLVVPNLNNVVSVLVNTTVTARPQSLLALQGQPKLITLAGVGTTAGDPLLFTLTSQPAHGTLSGFNSSAGLVTYTADASYNGPDSFQFTVTDTTTNQTSAAATVSLTILVPPTANPEAVTVAEGQTTILTLSGTAPNGDPLTFAITAPPAHGTFVGFSQTTHQGLYTSDASYTGPDSFQFTVTDTATTLTATATVSVTVAALPVANPQADTISLDQAQALTLTGSAPNNDPLSFTLKSLPAHGTLSGFSSTTGQVTYTPNPGFLGADNFQIAVTDTTTGLTSAAAPVSLTVSANVVSAVVGQFGGNGVWRYDRATGVWSQLTAANAKLLATDPFGDVAAEFPGQGVWEFTAAAGWKQLNGIDATQLAIDGRGDILAEFPGHGVGQFVPGAGWHLLTAANASLLVADAAGDVAAEFPGNGVWEFTAAAGWKQINGVDVTLLAMGAAGEIVANFKGFGVAEFSSPGAWAVLNGNQAAALAVDGQGDVTAEFPGFGVGEFLPGSGWRSLTGANAALLAAVAGDVFGAFPGAGVWEFDPSRGWFQLTAADASLLAVA